MPIEWIAAIKLMGCQRLAVKLVRLALAQCVQHAKFPDNGLQGWKWMSGAFGSDGCEVGFDGLR
ncbi:hypothetical protein GCM10009103_12170 [Pseudomonas koreensis]|nr:hypothetical protein GCM10009103_12170 [Pseudomonas koreensis]